jgi:glycyl-tRNA synthetase
MLLERHIVLRWTIKHLEDNTVTIRERDTMQQDRIAIADIEKIVGTKVDMNHLLRNALA